MFAIQYLTPCDHQSDGAQILGALSILETYLGGRVLAPGPGKPGYRVQGFFSCDDNPPVNLPDDCRAVIIPPGLAPALFAS